MLPFQVGKTKNMFSPLISANKHNWWEGTKNQSADSKILQVFICRPSMVGVNEMQSWKFFSHNPPWKKIIFPESETLVDNLT